MTDDGAESLDFRGQLSQLLRHSQQFGAQQAAADGFGPLGLFVQDPIEVGYVGKGEGAAGLSHSGSPESYTTGSPEAYD